MAAVTASTKSDSSKMESAGVETGAKMLVGLIGGGASWLLRRAEDRERFAAATERGPDHVVVQLRDELEGNLAAMSWGASGPAQASRDPLSCRRTSGSP